MLSKILRSKKRLDAADPADRLAAIAALDDAQAATAQAGLGTLVGTDPDAAVRRAALAKLTDMEQLSRLLDHAEAGGAAAERLARLLLDQGKDSSSPHASHPLVARSLLRLAPTSERISAITDPILFIDALLLADRSVRETLLEAPLLKTSVALTELERRSRDRDKTLNRLARNGLEAIKSCRARASQLESRLREIHEALNRTEKQNDEHTDQKLRALLDELDTLILELDALNGELTGYDETSVDLDSSRRRITELKSALAAAAPSIANLPANTPASATDTMALPEVPAGHTDADPFEPLVKEFEALEQSLRTGIAFETAAGIRQSLTERWLANADHRPPSDAEHKIFERVSHAYQELAQARDRLQHGSIPSLDANELPDQIPKDANSAHRMWQNAGQARRQLRRLQQVRDRIRWPDWAALPAELSSALQQADRLKQQLDTLEAQAEAELHAAQKLLATLDEQVEHGQSRAAQTSLSQLRAQLKRLPERLAEPLNRRLGQDAAILGELRDWQTFATGPKRQSLCEAMAQLVTQPLSPPDQAQRIKHLREEWRELGPITQASDRELLEQFNAAAEQAFEPCRAYFAEQAQIRDQNLAAREQICQQLETYLAETDWPNADFKAAEKILRTAREAWRPLHPVDRTAGNKSQSRFEALQSNLHDRIKTEWDRNLDLKRGIVAEAQALLTGDLAPRDRAETAKALQRRWRDVGTTPRRPDQQLWQALRSACDQIFAGLDDARQAAQAAAVADQQSADQLLAEFAAVIDSLEADQTPDQRTLADFQSRFDALPVLPERVQRTAARRFDDLVRSYQFALRDAAAANRRTRLRTLQSLDKQVSELEAQRAEGVQVTFDAPDPVFAERWSLDGPVPFEVLQRMTIEAEIAAGLESPPTERDTRLAIQVEIMNSGMGRRALRTDARGLAEDWCRAGPKDLSVAELRVRFFAALDVLERL